MTELYESDAKAGRATRGEARPASLATGERLTRRRRVADPFHIDQRVIPHGVTYEWKRESVFGQKDPDHWIGLRENHWKPVPAERHPDLALAGDTVIRRGGTVLCERPAYLTEEAQLEDLAQALGPVQQMEEVMYGTPAGQLTRDHPSVRRTSSVNQRWAPGEPINENGNMASEP